MKAFSIRCSFRLRSALLTGLAAFFAAALTGNSAQPPATDASGTLPIISANKTVRQELTNLDGLLMDDPKLEENLRLNLDQLTQKKFRENNPDIDALLTRQPGLLPALKTEKHFLIHRSIARLARSRVTRPDVIALDGFLTDHPSIAKALARKPSQIVEPEFLIANPALAKFFETHPALSSVLEEQSEKNRSATSPGKK